MKVLNPALFAALASMQGRQPSMGGSGASASWSVPAEASTGFDVAREYVEGSRRRLRRALVERHGWGEVYQLDCPCCGDSRGRLCVSHASLCRVALKSGEAEFGLNAHCFNESCESTRREDFRRLVWLPLSRAMTPRPLLEAADVAMSSDGHTSGGKSAALRMRRAENASSVPKPAWPVHSPAAPAEAAAYLESRGYDPEWLYTNFSVLACKAGAEYRRGDETKALWDTRVVIPVYQGGVLVGWQGRAVAESRQKYIFPLGCDKSNWLYNKDYAKFRSRVLVTEGVTNVWSFAQVCDGETEAAVATFGKSVSDRQMQSMQRLWGWHGNVGVLCLDPDAAHLLPRTVDAMLAARCFGGGLAVMLLPDGEDPASVCRSGTGAWLKSEFDACCARACADRAKILDGLEHRIAESAARVAAKAAASRQRADDPFARLL